MVEIEPSQVVLVRFPLAAVLADDHPWDRLQHFAGPHDRTRVELPGGHRTFARRVGQADQVLFRVWQFGEVPECQLPRHRDIRVERQVQDGVRRDVLIGQRDAAPCTSKVDQIECQLVLTGLQRLERIGARLVGGGAHARSRDLVQ